MTTRLTVLYKTVVDFSQATGSNLGLEIGIPEKEFAIVVDEVTALKKVYEDVSDVRPTEIKFNTPGGPLRLYSK